ncbi:MAG: bifunctional 4-hydroxy-2-oxoglutarate aldolase/2-dehydro-3-deoxy-phosphogluconate aldolase [Flavisolibacter sp.]|nr:bifunctional 4-hydroxy-2-oxoglutarate aldolase/2-dehydro-3-deoxy-phosphogluconate aldolase [Flavisolibacter sp.]
MDKKQEAINLLLQQKMLPLYYHESEEVSLEILKALYNGGVRIVEYTNRGENALANFKALRKVVNKDMPGLLLGIGTIKTKKQAKKFIEAGADFIVAPTINEEVGEITQNENLLWIPGCMTPTEIACAEGFGAEIVKIFPGNVLGPSYISAIKELFPGLKFMPTGGVEAEEKNLIGWFDAGVVAVGMGSNLISKQASDNKEFEQIKTSAANAMDLIKRITQRGE